MKRKKADPSAPKRLTDDEFAQRMRVLLDETIAYSMKHHGDRMLIALNGHFGGRKPGSAHELYLQQARFCCSLMLQEGKTAVSLFAGEATDVSDEERLTLRRWPIADFRYSSLEVRRASGALVYADDGDRGRQICVRIPAPQAGEQPLIPGGIPRKSLIHNLILPVRHFFIPIGGLSVILPRDRAVLAAELRRIREGGHKLAGLELRSPSGVGYPG